MTRLGTLGGYGYRTGRIALTLLIVLLAAAGLGISAGHISTLWVPNWSSIAGTCGGARK